MYSDFIAYFNHENSADYCVVFGGVMAFITGETESCQTEHFCIYESVCFSRLTVFSDEIIQPVLLLEQESPSLIL